MGGKTPGPKSTDCEHLLAHLIFPNATQLIQASQPIIHDPPLTKRQTTRWFCAQCQEWYDEIDGVKPKAKCEHDLERLTQFNDDENSKMMMKRLLELNPSK